VDKVLTKSLTIHGQCEFADQRLVFYAEMAEWLRDSRIRYRENVGGIAAGHSEVALQLRISVSTAGLHC
jgi:hypothetical protein